MGRRGTRAEIFLVGGAAMALAYDARRATRDLDAVFQPKDEVYAAAAAVASEHGLPDDWLNDAVKGFLPGDDPQARPVLETDSLRVDVASPQYLLAMKLLAARETDIDDIVFLYRLCGFTTAAEGLDLLESVYPGLRSLPRSSTSSKRSSAGRLAESQPPSTLDHRGLDELRDLDSITNSDPAATQAMPLLGYRS